MGNEGSLDAEGSLIEPKSYSMLYDEVLNGEPDPVNHPKHYTSNPNGIECIDVVEHMTFCLGNAVKYLWRADENNPQTKHSEAETDLRKAIWYIEREIRRLSTES